MLHRLILAALVLPAALPCQAREPQDAIRAVSVTILAGDGRGSGTLLVDRAGVTWCLTAAHVVADPRRPVLLRQVRCDPEGKPAVVETYAAVAKWSKADDLCLLRVGRGTWEAGAKLARGRDPGLDSRVYLGSTPLGVYDQHVSRGRVTNVGDLYGGRLWDRADLTLRPGSSGGGIHNARGELCGVVTHGSGERIAHYVPGRVILRWAMTNRALVLLE